VTRGTTITAWSSNTQCILKGETSTTVTIVDVFVSEEAIVDGIVINDVIEKGNNHRATFIGEATLLKDDR
jgi:hypothetical protein